MIGKDKYIFPVVGLNYSSNLSSKLPSLKVGVPVTLRKEPSNPFDSQAIMVLVDDVHLGYVPNRGQSCSRCWRSVRKTDLSCKNCLAGNEDFVIGGLAVRLANLDILNKECSIYISNLVVSGQLSIEVTLIVGEKYDN